jgi:hypothetical protein
MIMMDAEADESTLPLLPYEPAIVKQYRPMIVQRSKFSVQRSAFGGAGRSQDIGNSHIEGESVPMSLFNRSS